MRTFLTIKVFFFKFSFYTQTHISLCIIFHPVMNTKGNQNCKNLDINISKSYYSLQYSIMHAIQKTYYKSQLLNGAIQLKICNACINNVAQFNTHLGYKLRSHLFEYLIKLLWHPIQCIVRICYSSCDMFRNPMGSFPSLKEWFLWWPYGKGS